MERHNNSGLLFWMWTHRDRESAQRNTQTLCKPAAGRLQLAFTYRRYRLLTFVLSLALSVVTILHKTTELPNIDAGEF